MGCCGSKKKPLFPGNAPPRGQSAELRKILVGGGDDGSPPSSLDLTEAKSETVIDGQLWGELVRAGFVHLFANKETCNKVRSALLFDARSLPVR